MYRMRSGAAALAVTAGLTLGCVALPSLAFAEEAVATVTDEPEALVVETPQDKVAQPADGTAQESVAPVGDAETAAREAAADDTAAGETAADDTAAGETAADDTGAGETGAAEKAPSAVVLPASKSAATEATTAAQPTADPQPTTVEELAAQNRGGALLSSGTYLVENKGRALDVSGGSTADGGNAQIYQSNGTVAQEWQVEVAEDGFVTLRNLGSGKYLDVSAGRTADGTNVQQWVGNGSRAQRWALKRADGGFALVSALGLDRALDVSGGSTANGANVQLYQANGTSAQVWSFVLSARGGLVAGNQGGAVLGSGAMVLGSGVGAGSRALDVSSGSAADGARVQLWSGNGTAAQTWSVAVDGGYVTLYNVGSGKALDVSSGRAKQGARVQQWASNGTAAQRWIPVPDGKGGFQLRSALDPSLALDVSNASDSNGAAVQLWRHNTTGAQSWRLLKAPEASASEGWHGLLSAAGPSLALDVSGASAASGAAVQAYQANASRAQSWWLRRQPDGTYTLQASCSGLYLSDVGSLRQLADQGGASRWSLSYGSRGGYVLTNASTGKALSASGATTWLIRTATSAVSAGYYTIGSALAGGKALDVAGGSTANGANVQLYDSNGTAAQVFQLVSRGDDTFVIVNRASGKALDVRNAAFSSGANVQQWQRNGSAAQAWRITMGASGLELRSAGGDGSLVLDVSGGRTANGTNVQVWAANGTRAQAWTFAAVKMAPKEGNGYCWLNGSKLWQGMQSVVVKQMNKHYSSGREGNEITMIVLHHNDGNLSIQGCWDTWQSRPASAHYQVESGGRVGQLVMDCDTAWHAGNWNTNTHSIGIEHADCNSAHNRISQAALESGSHLVAALCVEYGLGRPTWGVNVTGHSDHSSTECPASLAVGGAQHNAYMASAQAWYDKLIKL